MGICVAGPVFTHKNTKGSIEQAYQKSTVWVEISVLVLHIYGARTMFLPLFFHHDTDDKQLEM